MVDPSLIAAALVAPASRRPEVHMAPVAPPAECTEQCGQAPQQEQEEGHPTAKVRLDFENLRFAVKGKGKTDITILNGVTGSCVPGRLLSIMGASGAGKTTLLDVLADNIYAGRITGGRLDVNGRPRVRRDFAKLSCYVMQRDILLSSATVRESVLTAALLKLPRTMPRAVKAQRVDAVLAELDLVAHADTLVGDESVGIKGCSGGQKRRVSVAVELVKDPALIFLDEPTSGLDSETASMLMATLVGLARRGRTVVATIHQPNSDITERFDDYMLLARGRCVYAGPWSRSVDWFAGQGFSCPLYTNPTDYYMHVVKDDGRLEKLVAAFAAHQAEEHAAARGLPAAAADEESQREEAGAELSGPLALPPATSWMCQARVLSTRFVRMWLRSPQMLVAEVVQYLFMALLVGLMYLQVTDAAVAGSFDRVSAIWFSLAVLCFTPSYTAVVVWDKERLLLRRELSSSLYSSHSYFFAKTLTTVPFQVAQTALFVCVAYFMVGFQANAAKFFIFLATLMAFQLASETIGLLVAIGARTATNGVVLLTLVLLMLLSFSGFLTSTIPVYFEWLQKVSYLTYALTAAAKNELEGLTLYAEGGQAVDGITMLPPQLENGLSVGANIAILVGQLLGLRALAYLALVLAARFKYL